MRTIVIEKMTTEEKLALIDELWMSLDADTTQLTPAQQEELDRRMAEADEDPGEPVEDVEARLRRRRG
jgi:putative addiction module component (TIGR02574 family)